MSNYHELALENKELGRKLVVSEDSDGTLRFYVFILHSEAPFRMLASMHGMRSTYRIDILGADRRRVWLGQASMDMTAEEFELIDKKFSLTGSSAEQKT